MSPQRLQQLLEEPDVAEALRIASPSLLEAVRGALQEPSAKDSRRSIAALVRYVARMSTRATPFGLMASCSPISIGASTRLNFETEPTKFRFARLDMDVICSLIYWLEGQQITRARLRYFANGTMVRMRSRAHYIEVVMQSRSRAYQLAAVDFSPELEIALDSADGGATLETIAQAIVASSNDLTLEAALEYVYSLVDAQVLTSELAPAVTGGDSLDRLIDQLDQHSLDLGIRQRLGRIRELLTAVSNSAPGTEHALYNCLDAEITALPIDSTPGQRIQVDLRLDASALSLGESDVATLLEAVEFLQALRPTDPRELSTFSKRFTERYERQQVPLLEVLDPEFGIGFDDVDTPAPRQPEKWAMFLLEKMAHARMAGTDELVMTAADLERWKEPRPSHLGSRSGTTLIRVAVLREAPAGSPGDHYFLLLTVGGSSALNMLGRFCHADPVLRELAIQLARAEQADDPDILQAEVVHLPQGRLGNVIKRPRLREYEIPLLANASVERAFELELSDLLVSVTGGIVRLHSRRLGREVLPRLASAHSFHGARNLAAYRFLCHLQSQHTPIGVSWDWGVLAGLPKLPRVRFGKVVVARARWTLSEGELARIRRSHAGPSSELQQLRDELNLPRFVLLAESDLELWVDLNSEPSVIAFVEALKHKSKAVLLEVGAPEHYAVTNGDHKFANEVLIPLVVSQPETRPARRARLDPSVESPAPVTSRILHPGGDCLFAKIYLGRATTDLWLRRVLSRLIEQLEAEKVIDRWFFLRYSDPEPHIRLRLFGPPQRLWSEGIATLHHYATNSDIVPWRLTVDSYQREIERYGGIHAIPYVENIFCHDSRTALTLVCLDEQETGSDLRIRMLASANSFLRSFHFPLRDRAAWALMASEPSADERAVWSKSYRQHRTEIEAALAESPDPNLFALRHTFDLREAAIADAVEAIQDLSSTGRLSVSCNEILTHLIHIGLNRLSRSTSAGGERQIYDSLRRYHLSLAARG